MIQINLLPGARRTKKSSGPAFSFGSMFAGVATQIKDPFLVIGVSGLALGLLVTAFLFLQLQRRESALVERETLAVQDSTRYATVIRQRDRIQRQRDSLMRQMRIISVVDGERYTWPHILDELSEHLPQYTWLLQVRQQSPLVSIATRDAAALGQQIKVDTSGKADTTLVTIPPLQLRVMGLTVDNMAITRYMRLLEASPFIENVTFVSSDLISGPQTSNREAIQFSLDVQFQQPDSSAIRTVPLTGVR